jgi:hypothetical protein
MNTFLPAALNLISHSSAGLLHTCPRKYYLTKVGTPVFEFEDLKKEVTFVMGHLVGEGLQHLLSNPEISRDELYWKLFTSLQFAPKHLLNVDDVYQKSVYHALHAIDIFRFQHLESFTEIYEIAIFNGQPAVELAFAIDCGNNIWYRGFIDAVLIDKRTGAYVVLENKTTASDFTAATYQESWQGTGYAVALDQLVPDNVGLEVVYCVYHTKKQEWDLLPFVKNAAIRLEWVAGLTQEAAVLAQRIEQGYFPKYGSCRGYKRDCEFFGTCSMNSVLNTPRISEESFLSSISIDLEKYPHRFKLEDCALNYAKMALEIPEPIFINTEFDSL